MKFETSVRIERAVGEVFDYVSNPRNFPRWNSAVQAVSVTSGEGGPGSTYLMERELRGGGGENKLGIPARDRPTEFALRTTSGPPPFVYRYRFDSKGATTVVHLAAEVELSGIAGAAGPLGGALGKRG